VTVSRKESEMVLLQMVAEGDGDFVTLNDLQTRSVMILKDLKEAGYIDGKTLFGGSANYRITSLGEKHMSEIQRELAEEEVSFLVPPDDPISWSAIWKRAGLLGSSVVAITGFIWIMLSQVVAPSAYCPQLPEALKTWLAPCVSLPTGEEK
jgi:hypothetical protein